jgi:hypothetical protein
MIAVERLALGIDPNSPLTVAEMVECTRLAESRNFAAAWVAEGRRGDVFALLSALALSTTRFGWGPGSFLCWSGARGSSRWGLRSSTKSRGNDSCWV